MNLYGFLDSEVAIAGMLYGMNPKTIVSVPAGEKINFGKAVFLNAERNAVVEEKYNDVVVVDISAYTTASKDIVIEVNGVTVTTLTTTGTIADDTATLVASINNKVEGVTATAGTGANVGKITIKPDTPADVAVELSYDGSDVTSSKVTTSSDCIYAGISVFHQNAFLDTRGCYVEKEAVNVMEKGYIWGKLASSVTPTIGQTAYVTKAGLFTTESSGNTQVGVFKSGAENGANNDSIALVSVE